MHLRQQAALLQNKFVIEKLATLGEKQEERILLTLLLMTLVERFRVTGFVGD